MCVPALALSEIMLPIRGAIEHQHCDDELHAGGLALSSATASTLFAQVQMHHTQSKRTKVRAERVNDAIRCASERYVCLVQTRKLPGAPQTNNHSDDSGDERYRGGRAQREADDSAHIAQWWKHSSTLTLLTSE